MSTVPPTPNDPNEPPADDQDAAALAAATDAAAPAAPVAPEAAAPEAAPEAAAPVEAAPVAPPEAAPVAPPVAPPVAVPAAANPYAAASVPPSNPYAPAAAAPTGPATRNTLGLIALIIAIVGFVLACLPWTAFAAWVPLLAALIVAIIGLTRRGQKKGTSIAALIISVVGWILAVVVTLVSFAFLANNEIQKAIDSPTTQGEPTKVDGGKAASIGDTITNEAGIAVTVTSLECGLSTVGDPDEYTEEVATGEFCQIALHVDNTGNKKQYVSAIDFTGYIDDASYSSTSLNSTFGEDAFGTDLNPGLEVDAVLNFDVPAGSTLETLQFQPLVNFMDEPLIFSLQ